MELNRLPEIAHDREKCDFCEDCADGNCFACNNVDGVTAEELREYHATVSAALRKAAEYEQASRDGRAIENELGCPLDIFWQVYRKLSGHGAIDHNLYALSNGEIKQIKPESIMSGTYSNYPQDCSFTYSTWDSENKQYWDTCSYYHFHDYGIDWFLTRAEAEAALGGDPHG